MDLGTKTRLIEEHLEVIRQLKGEDTEPAKIQSWPPEDYYLLWHVVVGMVLGMIGATASILFNVVGSQFVGQHPLQLIKVYLTFPMGQKALDSDSGTVLFVGCILYLVTGAVFGVIFHLAMSLFWEKASIRKRLIVGTMMGLGLWVANFYLLLSWLQPVLLGGSWILDEIPFWVAATTHLVFAWTMVLIDSWGQFDRRQTPNLSDENGL